MPAGFKKHCRNTIMCSRHAGRICKTCETTTASEYTTFPLLIRRMSTSPMATVLTLVMSQMSCLREGAIRIDYRTFALWRLRA